MTQFARKYTIENFRQIANAKGGVLLSNEYSGWTEKAWLWCGNCYLTWDNTFKKIAKGQWCKRCAGVMPRDIYFCQNQATLREGKCLSTEYINNAFLMDWECKNKHYFKMSLRSIISNRWCPYCSRQKKMDELAYLNSHRNHFICLEPKYKGFKNKYLWSCTDCWHEFEDTFGSVSKRAGCPSCGPKRRLTIKNLELAAELINAILLSTVFITIMDNYSFKCKECSFVWEATGSNVLYHKTSCPKCSLSETADEDYIYKLVKAVCPDALQDRKKILPNKLFELDIYVPSLKKAIEFDGRFHDFDVQKERDIRKNKECKEVGIELMRIYYKDWSKNKSKIEQEILSFLSNNNLLTIE